MNRRRLGSFVVQLVTSICFCFLLLSSALHAQFAFPPTGGGVGVGASNVHASIAGPATNSGAIDITALALSTQTLLNTLVAQCWTGTGITTGEITGNLTALPCVLVRDSFTSVHVTYSSSSNVLVVLNSNGGAGATGLAGATGPPGGLVDSTIMYVSASGNDSNPGTSWPTAKLTVAAAVAALPLSVGGVPSHTGTVNIGPGTFTETVTPIEFNANLHFVCAASGDNAEGVNFASVIKLGNSRNTALFSFTSAYFMANGYAHFLQMENCTLDGNATNNASAPSLVKQWNGGYQNTYRHVQFQNCKNFCLELDNQVVNFSCYSCTFGGQNGGAVFLNDLVGANVMLMVDTQIDNSGVNPIQIVQDTGDTGGSNIATFINTKFEATSGSTNHQHVIDFTPRSSGGHPFNLIVNGLTAINTIGSGTYALYEEAGGGTLANWEITGVNVGGYTAAFKNNQSGEVSNNGEIKHLINSDKVNTSDDAPELQLSGGPGIYTGSGTPEGSKAGCIGSIYMRIDGGTNTTLYKKESGACTVNTGWAAAGAGGGGSGVSVFTGSTGATNACGATPTISLADVGGKSTTVIGCTLSVNITSVTFASVPSGGGAIFYINFIQPTMGPTYTVAFGGSAVATCDSSIILANGITTTQGMQVMPDGTIRGTGCTNDLTGESDTGPEMACPTTTISGQGFWCFDSAAHTLVYFGNASPNRHAMPRVASGDQMAATDLSNGALGTGRVCLETMGCMSGGGGSFSSTTGNTLVTQTGSAIPLMEVTGVPAMAAGGSSGNCMNMEMGIDTNTGTAAGNILFYVDATLVFQVQTISAAAGYAYQRTFTYCNNAGVTNAQTITMKAPAGYCTTLASCASWATDNTGQFAIHPTVSNNIAMGSGTHTFSIYTTGTAGQAYTGNFLSVRQ